MRELCRAHSRTPHMARMTRARYVAHATPSWEIDTILGHCNTTLLSMSLRKCTLRGHTRDRTYGPGLPASRATSGTLHKSQRKGDEADQSHTTQELHLAAVIE